MNFSFAPADLADAPALAALHNAAAEDLTRRFGKGPWSMKTSEKGVLHAMRTSQVFVARDDGPELVGTLRLTTTKPWAIDIKYFSQAGRALYLLSMAVAPSRQRQGVGRRCLEEAKRLAMAWPADCLRLDAYDAEAGAGAFYARCGFKEVGRNTYRAVPLIYFEAQLGSRNGE
jgi:ribosomal protein S18 acetylase RimI-like enzyme